MGDRANIVIKQNHGRDKKSSRIYFYTHWSGSELPVILQAALKRGQSRWQDEPYLGRIIFSEMIKDAVLDETGYGISAYPTDNEYPLLLVDAATQTVALEDADGAGTIIGAPLTFSEFVALDLEQPVVDPEYPDDGPQPDAWRVLTNAVEAKAAAAPTDQAKVTKNPAASWPFPN